MSFLEKIFKPIVRYNFIINRSLHTSQNLTAWVKDEDPKSYMQLNRKVFPPQKLGEEPRPAYIVHQKANIKYSYDKMWYIASFIRAMTVDEAIKQLSFLNKKGAEIAKEVILEAQNLAVKDHNVEFKSNLWISEAFVGKGSCIKGFRRHARGRMGEVRYGYIHFFVKLEEGKPPKDYYKLNPMTPQQQLESWVEGMRKRKIINSY